MPVLVTQDLQLSDQNTKSVAVCQTTSLTSLVYEQWMYASSDSLDQDPGVSRVSPSFISSKGVFGPSAAVQSVRCIRVTQ